VQPSLQLSFAVISEKLHLRLDANYGVKCLLTTVKRWNEEVS
jgi:hypothetical protein